MPSELNTKLTQIKSQKDTYLLPGNIKDGITILGVTGTYSGGGSPNLQNKQVTISSNNTTTSITADSGYDGLDTVQVTTQIDTDWQPQSDWWDIDTILANDTENYAGKFICLLPDCYLTTTLFGWGADKIVTSDGTTYTTIGNTIDHTWDTTQDKSCSLGYKTRYVIYYFSNATISRQHAYTKIPDETLYCIFKNLTVTITNQNWQNGIFQTRRLLEFVNCINTTFTHFPGFNGCYKLQGFKNLAYSDFNSDRVFLDCFILPEKYITNRTYSSLAYFIKNNRVIKTFSIDTSNIGSFNETFSNCGVETIQSLDFNSATNVTSMFSGATSLLNINSISNIKITGLSFSPCTRLNHDSLVRILNALYDYSESGSTYTLTLGADNLAKLTAAEIAIGTNKGWTIS